MSRMSARFVAKEVGLTTKKVYEMWKGMGVVKKDKFEGWDLTELGRKMGGKLSKGNSPVPTFKFDSIVTEMINFWNKAHKK